MRRLCRLLLFSFCISLLFVGVFSFTPSRAFAAGADKIGTHLIQGDVGQQQNVLNKLTSKGLKSAEYPVVVMVYPDGAGTELLSSGFLTIARVNIQCDTNPGLLATLADKIPAGTPVVIGNEINNRNKDNGEWKCDSYGVYSTLFNRFADAWKGKGPLGISPMDTINGDFDADTALKSIFSTNIDRGAITAVFANVYQTGSCGYDPKRCSVDSGQWMIDKINSLAGKSFSTSDLYITEFGITTCGDYDCLQSFYEDHNDLAAKAKVGFSRPPGDANGTTWIHTVPAVCEYWELGSLKVNKPDKCGGGKRSSFVYPGIEDMPDDTKMRQMASGYTLMCGNQFKMQGDISGGWGTLPPGVKAPDCTKNPPDASCIISGVWGNVILDDTGTRIPLIRMQGVDAPNPSNAKRRFDDLEGYFGATYVQEGAANPVAGAKNVELLTPLANGVARKLLSRETECNMTLQYLSTIKSLCDNETIRSGYTYNDKLDADAAPKEKLTLPEGDCALYSTIPNEAAQYNTYKKIIDQMPSNFSCSNAGDPSIPAGWSKAFSKIELATSKGFKPAYLVYYIDRPEENPTAIDKRVNWMAPGEGNATLNDDRNIRDRIKIEKVYVPAGFAETDIGSVNQSLTNNNFAPQPTFFPTYTGGFMQTMTSLMPQEMQFTIARNRSLDIDSIGNRMLTSTIFEGANDGIKCKTCGNTAAANPLDPRLMIIRRINAGFLDSAQQSCSRDDFVGEQAKEHSHTINPSGTLDPVSPTKITASATLIAQRGGGEQETVKTFLLLPEEYRNITDYEEPFLNIFLTPSQQKDNPQFKFAVTKADQDATWKGAYKYLQLTGESTTLVSPPFDGPSFSYPDPNQVAPAPPVPGQPPTGTKMIDIKVTGKITADRDQSQIHTDPQVPGGKLARTLWEIMCNVTRPHNGVDTTTQYPGFESFFQKGLAACTDGAIPAGTTPNSPAICSGTTTVPASLTDLRALVRSVALQMGIPPNILWGTLSMEGSSIFNAISAGNKTISCAPNSVGAVGPLGILAKTCGGLFNNWEKYSVQAGVGSSSPCDLEASLKVAAVIMKVFYANPSQHSCNLNEGTYYPSLTADERKWVDAAASYNGSCTPLEGVRLGCGYPDGTENWLTYGECNVVKYAPRL